MTETTPKEAVNRISVLIFFIFVTLALFINLGVRPLDFEEPRRAVVAIEMETADNYIVPFTNGQHYYNKPPVWNWILVGFTKVLGSHSEFTYRLPTVISFLVMGLLLFRVSWKYLSRETVMLASGFLLTFTNQLFNATLNAEIDVFYSLIVFAQGCSIFYFERRERYPLLFIVSYLLAAIGFLTKGIPSIAFQGITLIVWLVAEKKFRLLFSWYHALGILTFVVTAGGYFFIYAQHSDPWPFLFKLFIETGDRTVASGFTWSGFLLHIVKFPLLLLMMLLPWCLYIPLVFVRGLLKSILKNDWVRFSLLFIAFNLIPYLLSPGTRERYLYMFLPFGAVILASLLMNTPRENGYRRFTEILYLICFAVATLLFAGLPFSEFSSFIPYSFVTCGLLAVAVVLTAIWYWRPSGKSPVGALMLLALIRLGYDFFVPYVRAEESVAVYYKGIASQVSGKDEPAPKLLGNFTRIEGRIPLLNIPVVINDQDYFPFSLPYYYYRATGKTLEFTNSCEEEGLYLAAEDFVIQQPHKVEHIFDEAGIELKDKPRMKLIRMIH